MLVKWTSIALSILAVAGLVGLVLGGTLPDTCSTTTADRAEPPDLRDEAALAEHLAVTLSAAGFLEDANYAEMQQERKREPKSWHGFTSLFGRSACWSRRNGRSRLTHGAVFGMFSRFHGRSSAHPSLAHAPVRLVVVWVRD